MKEKLKIVLSKDLATKFWKMEINTMVYSRKICSTVLDNINGKVVHIFMEIS